MACLVRAAAVMPCRTAAVVSRMLASIMFQLRLTMVSINQLPLTWSTIMYDATLARMGHGKYVGSRGEPRRDGVCVLRKGTLYPSLAYLRCAYPPRHPFLPSCPLLLLSWGRFQVVLG